MGRRTWIKIFSDKWLRGSLREETAEVRGIWMDLLALAADSAYGDEGVISIAPKCGLNDQQITAIFNIDIMAWRKVKQRLIKTDRITINSINEISIINWKKYQSEYQRTKEAQKKYYQATKVIEKGDRKHTPISIKEKREERREKEKREERKDPSCPKLEFTDEDMKLTESLGAKILVIDPKHKFSGGRRKEKWANVFRLMREQDNRTHQDIWSVMSFAFNDSFWSAVVQSASNLRDNYNKIRAKMLKTKKTSEEDTKYQVILSNAKQNLDKLAGKERILSWLLKLPEQYHNEIKWFLDHKYREGHSYGKAKDAWQREKE